MRRRVAPWPVIALVVACGGDAATRPGGGTGSGGGAPSADEPPPADGGGEVPAGPRTITIEMEGIAFSAPDGSDFVTIGLGERVRWVNLDGTLHTATSVSVPPGGKGFNSGRMQPGDEYVFTPNLAGTWEYQCLQYPDRMSNARILVVP